MRAFATACRLDHTKPKSLLELTTTIYALAACDSQPPSSRVPGAALVPQRTFGLACSYPTAEKLYRALVKRNLTDIYELGQVGARAAPFTAHQCTPRRRDPSVACRAVSAALGGAVRRVLRSPSEGRVQVYFGLGASIEMSHTRLTEARKVPQPPQRSSRNGPKWERA